MYIESFAWPSQDYTDITPFVILNILRTLAVPFVSLCQRNFTLQLQ